jgi:hypothetical protein
MPSSVSFRIDDEMKDRLDDLSSRRGLNVSALFRQAIERVAADAEGSAERANFSLTLKERVNLANQFEILAAVTKTAEAETYRRYVTALRQGYEAHYREIVEVFADPLSREDCIETMDILAMYSDLLYSYDRLSDQASVERSDVLFPGFDGNYEGARWRYVRYLFDDDKFSSVKEASKGHDFNSHVPVLDGYRRMLAVWRKHRPTQQPMSAESIAEVLQASNPRRRKLSDPVERAIAVD